MAESQRNSGGMDLVPLVQCLLKAQPSSWDGGFAQGLSGCILWVSRDGLTTSSVTHPQHCHWHHAQTVLTSRLLSSSLLASQEMLRCHVLVVPPCWPSPACPGQSMSRTALSLSLVLAEHHWAGAQGNIWLTGECQRCLGHQSHPLCQQ